MMAEIRSLETITSGLLCAVPKKVSPAPHHLVPLRPFKYYECRKGGGESSYVCTPCIQVEPKQPVEHTCTSIAQYDRLLLYYYRLYQKMKQNFLECNLNNRSSFTDNDS